MSHDQYLDIRDGIFGNQRPFRVAPHVAGDQHIKIIGTAQYGQALLIHVSLAHRRIERHGDIADHRQCGARYPHHVDTVFPGQLHQPLPNAVFIFDIRQVQRIHPQPGQQRIQAVGMIRVKMGNHHRLEIVEAHRLQFVGYAGTGVDKTVAAAAVHQHGFSVGVQRHAFPLPHIHHRYVHIAGAVQQGIAPNRQQQRQYRHRRGKEILSLAPSLYHRAQAKAQIAARQPDPQIGIVERNRVIPPAGQAIGQP